MCDVVPIRAVALHVSSMTATRATYLPSPFSPTCED